jgi:quercetin dioxygenase-like cupin family protein
VIQRFKDFNWEGVGIREYKDTPGSHLYVTRRELLGESQSAFQVRYFEVAPGGYTSFENHEHEHWVLVVRGKGRVRLGSEWSEVELNDTVHVSAMTPHQFANNGNEPFGILCIVDKERDRPRLLDPEGNPRTSE